MSQRYEYARAAGEKNLYLVFPEGAFESLGFEIRLAARWTGQAFGALSDLRPADRWQLRHWGYVILRESPSISSERGSDLAADGFLREAA